MAITYSAILWVMVGICLYAALTHLQIGLRRPIDHTHSLFGLVALSTAFAAVANIEIANSTTPIEYQLAAWHSTFMVPFLFALFPWFIYSYSLQPRRWMPGTLSIGALGVLFANLLTPYSLILSAPPILGKSMTPWGEEITRSLTEPNSLMNSIWVIYFLNVVYVVYSAWFLYRMGPARRAISFALAMTPLVAALSINILIGIGVLRGIYVGSLGLVAMIVFMSISLGGEWRRVSKKLQILLDHVPAVVYTKRLDGRYMFINRQFEQLYRLPARKVIGATDRQLFDDVRVTQSQAAEHAALAKGQPVESEEIRQVPSMSNEALLEPRAYSWLHFPLFDGRGIAYAICGISTDITERKASADTLRALAASLDRRVSRRTDQLANVNRELEAFAYSVSHDLRAPLTAVNGFAELLLREYAPKLDQTAQRFLNRIREGSLRMSSLIQDLLDLSRVTQQVVNRQEVDLVNLANDAFKSLQEANLSRHLKLIAPEHLVVNADARLLGIAITNLIDNAWKYTSKIANGQVEIGMLERDNEIQYFVKDNGAGFDAAYAERLFRPFVRLHSEKDFPGTGIGLATVARIISRHGGRVWAEGTPQAGATFYFTLPNLEEELEENGSARDVVA